MPQPHDLAKRQIAEQRHFTLLDGMVVIAALAVECVLIRQFDLGIEWEFLERLWTEPDWFFHGWAIDRFIGDMFGLATAAALGLTLMSLLCRLRRPRPHLRRLASQPGFAATLAAVLPWTMAIAYLAIFTGVDIGSTTVFAGFGVACSWGILALSRRWRAEPWWVDRLGRLTGVVWMALAMWGIHLRAIC